MKIDLSKLFKGLEALPHMPVPEPENVPPYVLTHILEPLKTNHAVSFMELDFESFTEEDLEKAIEILLWAIPRCQELIQEEYWTWDFKAKDLIKN